jgi:hypothetical protein
MEQVESGSAERKLATPETARDTNEDQQDDAPSAKQTETETDKKLPEDQQAMQPDSE